LYTNTVILVGIWIIMQGEHSVLQSWNVLEEQERSTFITAAAQKSRTLFEELEE
jgi:hypothetical protein